MELLQKVFTNIPLNASQSLPKGHGAVDIGIGNADRGNALMAIRDNGCAILPEHMQMHHRLFQTINERDVGIGLCHTSPIVELDGDPIGIDSQLNRASRWKRSSRESECLENGS